MPETEPSIDIRRATDQDDAAIIALAGAALGWEPDDPNPTLFAWKHRTNPFGESPMWVAQCADQLVGFRAMMQWRFVTPSGERKSAVRAVDTATHPDFQGRGIFRQLTTEAIESLRTDGVDFIFNTPNAQSRPGYLKMGWVEVGRPAIHAAPTRLRRLAALRGARTAADKWSLPCDVGLDAADALTERGMVEALLATIDGPNALRTDHDAASLAWRYGLPELRYRVIPVSDRLSDGFAIVRLRRRGTATEAVVAQILVRRRAAMSTLIAKMRRQLDADYLLAADRRLLRHGFVPVPGQGPALTTRDLAAPGPALEDFDFSLGDLELF